MKKNIYWRKILLKTSKKGSSIVFLSIVLSGIIFMILAFILASQRVGTIGYSNSILTMSFKSVMSEYNVELKDRYGMFGFAGNSADVENKVFYYSDYSFENRENINIDSIDADTSLYSLANTDVAKKQFLDYSKYAIANNLFEGIKEDENKISSPETKVERVLRNNGIISTLPSNGYNENPSAWKTISNAIKGSDNFIKEGTETYLLNQYILNMFNNYYNTTENESFFTGEIEYILGEDFSDKENYRKFINEFRLLRNALNVIYIITDPVKFKQTHALAQSITPGVAAIATQAAIVEIWALAEAENDVLLLENGKKVPLIKSELSWATSLDNIMTTTETEYVEPSVNLGYGYEGYLFLFLTFMDEELKIAKTLDLIQINMIGLYDSDFLIVEHNTGFDIQVTVNGKEYVYKEEY